VAGKVDCRTLTASDGSFRCLPFVIGTMNASSDPLCMTPAGSGAKSSCEPADSYLSQTVTQSCVTRTTILRAGDRLSVGYENFSTGCSTSTAGPFTDYFSAGDEVPPTTFVAATLATADGTERVRRRNIGTPAGTLPSQALWDTKLDRACTAVTMSDGTYRCVGASRPRVYSGFFADAQCTQPALDDAADPTGDVCESGYYYKADPGAQCPTRWHIFNVDDKPFTGSVYRMDPAMGCVSALAPRPDSVHLIGAEIPPSDFVEIMPPAP
jgi:hypothetical protein